MSEICEDIEFEVFSEMLNNHTDITLLNYLRDIVKAIKIYVKNLDSYSYHEYGNRINNLNTLLNRIDTKIMNIHQAEKYKNDYENDLKTND